MQMQDIILGEREKGMKKNQEMTFASLIALNYSN
jgi:hypothetical protein